MNSYVIHCTTCQARLKVNDESAIGGIYACPKCGSMVHVLPPTAETPTNAATKPTRPASKPLKTAKLQAEAIRAPAVAPTPNAKPTAAPTTRAAAPPPLPPRKPAEVTVAAAALPIAAAKSASKTAIPKLPASKVSLATQAALKYVRQEPWLFGGALAAGITIGIGVWLALVSGGSAKAGSEPAAPVQAAAETTSAVPRPPAVEPTKNATQQPAVEPTAEANRPDDATAVRQEEIADEVARELAPAKEDTFAAVEPAEESAKPADAVEPADAPVAEPEAAPAPAVESPTSLTSKQLAIEARMKGRVQAMEFRKVTLSQFALFVSDLIAAPVELDLPALKTQEMGAETSLTVKLKATTVGGALTTALESHGLVYAIRGDRVVITTKQGSGEK